MQTTTAITQNNLSPISDRLSLLIAQQLLLIGDASRDKQDELSSLIACQLFDTLDWARLNLKSQSLMEISTKVSAQIPNIFQQECDLEHIENYAENSLASIG